MKLRFDRRALRDLEHIHDYIAPHDRMAAARVILRIERTIKRLLVAPLSGRQGNVAGIRLLVVPGLPYVVAYRVRDETIDIISVIHTARSRRS